MFGRYLKNYFLLSDYADCKKRIREVSELLQKSLGAFFSKLEEIKGTVVPFCIFFQILSENFIDKTSGD